MAAPLNETMIHKTHGTEPTGLFLGSHHLPPIRQGGQGRAPECQEGVHLPSKAKQVGERNDISQRRFQQFIKVTLWLIELERFSPMIMYMCVE